MSAANRAAVFLDRDGVLMQDVGYPSSPEQVHVYDDVAPALVRLRDAGFLLPVVTNQSGIARGYFSEQDLDAVNDRLAELLGQQGATLDGVWHCPHLPGAVLRDYDVECGCRKPAPGLMTEAAAALDIDPGRSFAVGDRERDVLAGQAAGCRTVLLVREGTPPHTTAADGVAADMMEAADLILEWGEPPSTS